MTPMTGTALGLFVQATDHQDLLHSLEGLRITTIEIRSESADVTTDASGGWRKLLDRSGRRSIRIKAEGFVRGCAAELRLRDLSLSSAITKYEVPFEGGRRLSGDFMIECLTYDGPTDEEATYALSLESAGAVLLL